MPSLSGIAGLVSHFQDPQKVEPSPPPEVNTGIVPLLDEIRARKRKRRDEEAAERVSKMAKTWDPKANTKATENAYLTLFVGRLAFTVTEEKLRAEFERYGKVKSVIIVRDQQGKSRGYGFIEFEDEKEMQAAYERMDGARIEERRIVVDVERGRTVSTWRPRRLGGGLGGTRLGPDAINVKSSGRYQAPAPSSSTAAGGYDRERDDRERYRGGAGGGGGGRDDRGGDRYRGGYSDRDRERDRRDGDRDRRDFRDDRGGVGGHRDRDFRDRDRDREFRDRDRDRDRDYKDRDRDRRDFREDRGGGGYDRRRDYDRRDR